MYPAGGKWSVSFDTSTCDAVIYTATFSWNELLACTNKLGASTTIQVQDIMDGDLSRLALTGRLLVAMVQPIDNTARNGLYRVTTIADESFELSVYKSSTNALGSISIQNFQFSHQ